MYHAPIKTGFLTNPTITFLYIRTEEMEDIPERYFNGRYGILEKPVCFIDSRLVCHTAEPGLITDGGSIPKFWWRIAGSPWTYCLLAYLIHDKYVILSRQIKNPAMRKVARLKADKLFLEMVEWIDDNIDLIDIPEYREKMLYAGVRLGAWADATLKNKD